MIHDFTTEDEEKDSSKTHHAAHCAQDQQISSRSTGRPQLILYSLFSSSKQTTLPSFLNKKI